MKFPVDVLAAVSHSELEQRAQSYMRELLYSNPECPEQLTLPDSTKVDISISSVGLVPLYGSCDTQKVLALFAPADPFTPVALYLLDQWWTVGDLLHTADSSRDGLVQVDTLGERIVLYVLNRIVYRVQEMSSDELPFLCHGEQDFAKILWKNGQAVGFYSVKPTGSPCSSFSSRIYPLPVMDSLFVRQCHRGKGLGLHMLEDFVDSFKEDHLGLRYPLTTAMYKVCQRYLRSFPGDSELLWEVDSSRLSQRTSISSRIHSMSLRGASRTLTYSESAVSGSVHHPEENVEEITIVKTTKGTGPAGQRNTDEQCSTDIRISEEVTLLRLVQNTEVAQTEELLEVTTKNGTDIVVTELEEDIVFDKVTSLSRSQEDSEITQNLNILCSSVITVENVASEIEECLHSQEECTEESSHKTAPPEGTVTMQRVLRTRTVVNIPQPSNVGDVDGDVDNSVDEFGITQGLKHGENVTAQNQTKNIMEEMQVLHRMPLRNSITTPKPTRASMRLNQVQRSTVEAGTQEHGPDTEQHESQVIEDTVELTGGKVCLAAEVTNEAEKQEATDIVTLDKATSEELSNGCVVPEIPPEAEDSDDAESETSQKVLQLDQSPSKYPEKAPEEVSDTAAVTEEALCITTAAHESLSHTQGETEVHDVVQTRTLRSGARAVGTPRMTRSRQQNVKEEIVETTIIKRGKKSTGRKQVSKSKEQTQELEASSAEEDTADQMSLPAEVGDDWANKDEPINHFESLVVTETQDTVSKEDNKDSLHEDNEEEVKGETGLTEEKTAVVECSSAEVVEEEKTEEESSTVEVGSVLLSTTEAEDTQQTESSMERDEESQPVMELNTEESGIDKEPEQESVPEQSDKTTPILETRCLRSGPKIVTATPRHRHKGENQTAQPGMPDRPQEEPQNEQDTTEEQSQECVAPEIPSEVVDNDDAQSETKTTEVVDNDDAKFETKIAAEVVELVPSQSKDPEETPEECPEDVSGTYVATDEAPCVVTTVHENLSSNETEKVIEIRALRSGARPISTVLTPRTTRSSKRKVEEEIVEKSTGRKRVSRSKAQTQELEASSAEEDTREEVQTETSELTTIENNGMSLSTEVDEDGAGKDKPIKDLEPSVSNEESKNQGPALVEEDALHKEDEEVKSETDITETAEAVEEEKTKKASSTAKVKSVLLNTTEPEDTQQIESTMEMHKESQSEAVMELNTEESGIDKEPEQESVPKQSDKTTPIVETRSLRSGPKTVTSTYIRRHTGVNQTVQPETPDRPQEEPQNEQDSTEKQSKECVAPEIPSEVIDNDDAQSETKIDAEVVQLVPSQTKIPEETIEECPETGAAVASEEAPSVVTTEHENLSSSETKKVIETRDLRSGARPVSTVLTPRTTRSSKRKVEEEIVEKTTTKRGKKSTGRKRVSRSKAQTQELSPSSAEDKMTKEVQTETPGGTTIENNDISLSTEGDEDMAGEDKPIEDSETTVSNEDSKDQEPELVEEDTLHKDSEEVKGETNITEEETVVVEHSSAEAVDEEKTKKASSAAELESVLLNTTEAEGTQQTESTMEMDKESEAEMELNIEESGIDKEPEQESVPGQSPRHIHTGRNHTAQPETPVRPQEEPQSEQDSTEEQSQECVAPEIPSEGGDNDAQFESKITTEIVQLIPSQTKDHEETPEKCPEVVSGAAVASEDALPVVTTEHENLSSNETEKVVETRALRSGVRPISTVLTPRTTRSSKQKVEEEIVEKNIKRGKKSTGRKQLSRSKVQTEEPESSSAEDDMKKEVQTETPGHITIENNDKSLSMEVDEDGGGKDKPIKDLETMVSKEDSKDEEPALVKENTLHKENEEVKGETGITEEETAVVEHSSAEDVDEEKTEKASSTAEVESFVLSTTEAENRQQTESTMEMNKESQPEAEMELNVESSIDKEPKQESVPEQSDETTPVVETRSLRSGPKTVTATPRCIYTEENQTAQPEMPDRPQEKPQNEQDSTEEQSKEQSEIPSEVIGNDNAQFETKITAEVVQLIPSQTKDSEETPDECPEDVSGTYVATDEAPCVVTTAHENLSTSKTKVVETRALRSRARLTSMVPTPRTTRSSKQKAVEETVEKRTIKKGKKSTGRKQVSRSKAQIQELEVSSAEDDTTEEVQTESSEHITMEDNDMSLKAKDEDRVSTKEPVKGFETMLETETQDTVSKEDSKDQEHELVEEDTLHKDNEEVKGETDITEEETAVGECFCAEAVEEEKTKEASSTDEVESALLSTTEAENIQQTESTMEMNKESQSEAVMELNIEESGIEKEPEQESVPGESDKTAPIGETNRPKTATPRHRHTGGNQTAQPEMPDRPQEEPQNEQDSTEKQSKECVAPEISSEVADNDDAQSENKIAVEVVQLVSSQPKDPEETPEECPEDVSCAAVASEEASPVVTTEHENLSSSETEKVIETRDLRSGARPIRTVLTPRTIRSSKRKVEEEIVEKTVIKQGKKSTERKRVSRSKAQTQESEHSSAEDDMTEEVQTETPEQTTIENNDMSLSTEVDEDGAGKDKPIEDLETTISKEDSKDQRPTLVEENTLCKDNEEVKGETDITEEETAVVEHSIAEAVEEEKTEEASSTTEVESVLPSATEGENTQQTESTMEVDKESQPVMELNPEDSGIDKEPEQKSVPEQSDETTPVVETRSLRSGPKTVTATPRQRHTGENQTAQPVTPDRPQQEPQNEQDSTESKEHVAPEIPSEVVENDDAESETKIISKVPLLDLPRVAVVLVDMQKVQVVKSINETATLEQQDGMKDREDNCIHGDEDAVETNQQEQVEEVEMDLAEGPHDHIDSQVPLILENADSSFSEASLVSPANLCTEDLETPVTPSPKRTRLSDIQHKQEKVKDFQKVYVKAHDTEVQEAKLLSCQTPRRSSRKRARVDYRDNDDQSESLTSENISKDTLTSRRFSSEPQSEEEESSEGIVLSLCLDEEEEQSASEEELVIITGKNLRSRSVPSIIISPHSKTTPLHSTVCTPKQSPERTPRQTRLSAKASPRHTSKRPRK